MKLLSSLFAITMLSAIQPLQAGVNDPLKTIYRISGVRDTGDTFFVGVATSITCTNFGNVTERIRFIVKNDSGTVVGNETLNVAAGDTETASTHETVLFFGETSLSPDTEIAQGSVQISATSQRHIFCSAMILDASVGTPEGIALHMVRSKPASNTQE